MEQPMSSRVYTTGEIAHLCGVSVRTVQYYDIRGILVPSQLSEGGRRLYTEEQVRKLQLICFLRNLGISIQEIGEAMSQDDCDEKLSELLEQQRNALATEINEQREKLSLLDNLRRDLKKGQPLDVATISDLAVIAASKKQLWHLRAIILSLGFVMDGIQVLIWCLGLIQGIWWPFIPGIAAILGIGIWISCYYYRNTVYLCPHCHTKFRPNFKMMFWAKHTPNTRYLTCTTCGKKSDCREIAMTKN